MSGKVGNTPLDLEKTIADMKNLGLRRWLLVQLVAAFEDARKGKLKTYDEHGFEENWVENLVKLRDSILEHRYEPGASVTFVIFEPMVREIFAAPFRDRVVHHFLYRMQAGWWDRRFIYDSYSCRVEKGTLFGVKRAQRFMRLASDNYTKEAKVVKLDIQGYFMSLPREKLYKRVRSGLEEQFGEYMDDPMGYQLFKICDFLWKQILFDDPILKARKRGQRKYWNPEVLPPSKSLYQQPYGKGIVIGNLTSQLVSNIYLDMLDRYVYYELGYKYYGRYVDDCFIMVPEEEYEKVKQDLKKIKKFLEENLELKLHPKKKYCQSIYKGMSFLGARVYPRCLCPSDRLQANFRQAATGLMYGYKDLDSVVSYLGLMVHLDADKMIQKVFDEMGWER